LQLTCNYFRFYRAARNADAV